MSVVQSGEAITLRRADVKLLIKNAKVFNHPERVEYVMADALELIARKVAKRYRGPGPAATSSGAAITAVAAASGKTEGGGAGKWGATKWVSSCGYNSDTASVGGAGGGASAWDAINELDAALLESEGAAASVGGGDDDM